MTIRNFYPEYIPEHNMTVYHVPFNVDESILSNAEDDGYSVYVNDSASEEDALAAVNHAIYHKTHADFDRHDVQDVEAGAHAAS